MDTNITLDLNQLEDLDETLMVSRQVFKPSHEEHKKYHNRDDWLSKLNDGGLLITAKANENIAGFAICYPKEQNFHIWNVGVLEKYRKLGIWKKMYSEIEKIAREKKYKKITLNTYRKAFPGMYAFVTATGFSEYKTEGNKSFFSKTL